MRLRHASCDEMGETGRTACGHKLQWQGFKSTLCYNKTRKRYNIQVITKVYHDNSLISTIRFESHWTTQQHDRMINLKQVEYHNMIMYTMYF